MADTLFEKLLRFAKVCGPFSLILLFGCWLAGQANSDHICLSVFSFFQMSAIRCVFWPTAFNLDCISNFEMFQMVFTSLVDEIKFMLISSHYYLLIFYAPLTSCLHHIS